MCGIVGIIEFKNVGNSNIDKLQNALIAIEKRGPDAVGMYKSQQIALGHRRLSIIDTSSGANQPFFDETKKHVLVFNGEVYNYKELKADKLNQFNINFKTNSDTEVLLYLLIYYGAECLPWISGFFSFAFLNTETNEVLLARDKFGKKPLLIYQDENKIIFASEMKAIFAFGITKQLNTAMVKLYFKNNYLPPNFTIIKNVRKLSPGSYIKIINSKVTEFKYYNLTIQTKNIEIDSYQIAQEKLAKLMDESVQKRLISDVPIGAFLSGGIDSSVVVALASKYKDKLKTFTIGYKNNPKFDESKYAELVAKKYNTDHQTFFLDEKDYENEIFTILDYLDEPFADSSAIPQYILSKLTKKEVTVALSGDGADEVFAGYNKHKAEWQVRNNKIFSKLAALGSPILQYLPNDRNTKIGNLNRQIKKFAYGASLSNKKRYIHWCSVTGGELDSNLFTDKFNKTENKIERDEIIENITKNIKTDDINEILLTDVNLVLPGDMLYKVDMMSMANSLEVRSPFLDSNVVEYAFSLPAEYKIDKNLKKKIVQDTFRNILPTELYNRPKQGFEIPLLKWFRKDFHSYIFEDLLNKEFIENQGIFNYDEIMKLKQKLNSNNPEFVYVTIWAMFVFQYWFKKNEITL